jgi:hypothetical protein
MASSSALAADDGVWSVSKSSGEVWVTTAGAQQVSLEQENALKPGDVVRTGRNGRVLLLRGEETILVSPNSVIGLPTEKKDGMSTTILQQAGSILLEVEKRNVKHFEVETPYLAAVVKGTQFSVTVGAGSTKVDVKRGQVEVSDFKSGQIAQIMPGQTATSFARGRPGLSLSGSGTFAPIEQGKPRASSIERITVPKGRLLAPNRNAGNGEVIHALRGHASFDKPVNASREAARANVIHLSRALGEVRLNVGRATHGLAHGSVTIASHGRALRDASGTTIWSDNRSGAGNVNALAQTGVNNAPSTAAAMAGGGASASPAAMAAAAATDSGSAANGNGRSATGNGNSGNGNNGNHGIGNNGNGNNGNNGNGNNGNGNHGVGNGNGNGNSRH